MNNWVKLLLIAKQCLVNYYNEIIKTTSYEAIYNEKPENRALLNTKKLSELARQKVEKQKKNDPQPVLEPFNYDEYDAFQPNAGPRFFEAAVLTPPFARYFRL